MKSWIARRVATGVALALVEAVASEQSLASALELAAGGLAWEDAYDLAVLATSDADLVPAVEFLGNRGRRVIQAGFPPLGVALATASWASFDVAKDRGQISRP